MTERGRTNVTFTEKSNSTARVEGTSVGAEALGSAEFVVATVSAFKPISGATKKPVDNTGTVYICGAAEDLSGAFVLEPGESMSLPEGCNLSEFFLAVDTANDGVSIAYTS